MQKLHCLLCLVGSIFISNFFSFFNFPICTCHSHPSFVFVCAEKDWLLVAAGGSCCDLAPPISYILILYYILLHYILNHIYIILCIKYSILLYSYLLVARRRIIMTDLAEYHQLGVGSFFILKQKNQQCLLKILILILKAFSSCGWWFFGWKDWLGFTW